MRFRLVASSLLLGLTTCARPEPVTADPQIGALTDVLTRQNPNPVNLSQSGTFVLLKSMHATDFELEVRRRRDDVIVARDRAGDTQLAPTWRFDDGALAFLSDHDGDQRYRPFVLDIASGKRRAIEPSPSTEATALRWEPRGTRLAYLVAERGTRERMVAVVGTAAAAPAPMIALDGLFEHAGFVWSPDGGFIAGVSRASPSTVVIGNSRAAATRSVRVAQDGEIRSLAWSEDGARLLLTLRRNSDEYFGLAEVSAETGDVLREVHASGDITGPLYLPGDGLAFHVNDDGEVGVYICRARCDERRRIGPGDGTSSITGFSPDGATAWVLHTGRVSPPALFGVELDSGAMMALHSARSEAADGAIAGERIDVESLDRRRVPAYLWRARNLDGRAPAALIRVHGGPDGQSMRIWDPAIQLLAQHGVHVISVNYRGSSGYGARFEHATVHGDTERAFDVIAVRNFAERQLGVPPERIVLLGHSYGARLVAEAVRRDSRPVGTVVLLSYVQAAAAPHDQARRPRVVAYHGENDIALAPAEARRLLVDRFGDDALERFVELPREGHTFRRVESWARVYAALLALLNGTRLGEDLTSRRG
jgi:dipeptidyl aminopeptidase/acylaminoacyl peptidase